MAVNGRNMDCKAGEHYKFRMSEMEARQLMWSRTRSPLMWVRWYGYNAVRVKAAACTHS